jgi:hypothetical protein
MSEGDGSLRGVGGWLALLVAILAVLSPLGIAASVLGLFTNDSLPGLYGADWPLYRNAQLALAALHVAGSWYLAWRLISVRTPQTVRVVILGLWLLGPGLLLVETVLTVLVGRVQTGSLLASAGADILFALVWTLYLRKSRRVANTYAPVGQAEPDAPA